MATGVLLGGMTAGAEAGVDTAPIGGDIAAPGIAARPAGECVALGAAMVEYMPVLLAATGAVGACM